MGHTEILILINVVASFYAWNKPDIYSKWMMNPYKVQTGQQYYRFVTSGFIHADYLHLIFNMVSLYSFGSLMERVLEVMFGGLGVIYFYVLYLTALIISEVPTFLKHRHNPGYNSLGASGAVSAIIFASVLLFPLNNIYLFFIPMPGFIFAFLYLGYSYYLSKNGPGGVNHDAHFYGAVYGIVAMIFLEPMVVGAFFEQLGNWSLF